jgi:hypothetical protein
VARSATRDRRRGVPWWAPLLALVALASVTGVLVASKLHHAQARASGVLGARTVVAKPKLKPKHVVAKAKPGPALTPGTRAAEHSVRVLSVVGQRIFWVGRNKEHRTLVHVQGVGTRRLVLPGQRVTFVATVSPNNVRRASAWGLTRREGRDQFRHQRVHFEVYGPRMRFVG